MAPKDLIRQGVQMSREAVLKFLNGLADEDLRLVPVEGMNPIAWQLGHLIVTDCWVMGVVKPGSAPELPPGFAEAHPRKPAESNGQFLTRDQYVDLWNRTRDAYLEMLESLTDADLDAPGPEQFRAMFPTVGALLNLSGLHAMQHGGQFVATRRQLKKPIAF